MARQTRISHKQRQILDTLYDYRESYPGQWVPGYRITNDLRMGEAHFSCAIKRLLEPHDSFNSFDPFVEMTSPSIVYREHEGNVIPLPDNATMSDALFAVEFAWDGSDGRRRFYRITDFGVECLERLTIRNRFRPRA